MTPDLSICIVNHNTPDLTAQCVQSVYDTVDPLPVEVLVVNNTPDNQAEIAAWPQRFPGLQGIQNIKPLGFAANQNQMMQRARGRYLLPLNSDTVVQPGALRELVNFMDEHPQAGIAGPKLIHPDGTLQPSGRNFPTPLTHFLEMSGLWHLFRNSIVGRYYYLCSPHKEVCQVDWLTGACLIVRREAIEVVGYYNDSLFPMMYCEDLEWCWQMHRKNWTVMFNPNALVIHFENCSPVEQDRLIQINHSLFNFAAEYYSPAWQLGLRLATILAILPKLFVSRSHQRREVYKNVILLALK